MCSVCERLVSECEHVGDCMCGCHVLPPGWVLVPAVVDEEFELDLDTCWVD